MSTRHIYHPNNLYCKVKATRQCRKRFLAISPQFTLRPTTALHIFNIKLLISHQLCKSYEFSTNFRFPNQITLGEGKWTNTLWLRGEKAGRKSQTSTIRKRKRNADMLHRVQEKITWQMVMSSFLERSFETDKEQKIFPLPITNSPKNRFSSYCQQQNKQKPRYLWK